MTIQKFCHLCGAFNQAIFKAFKDEFLRFPTSVDLLVYWAAKQGTQLMTSAALIAANNTGISVLRLDRTHVMAKTDPSLCASRPLRIIVSLLSTEWAGSLVDSNMPNFMLCNS
jgi:hypothetical protein